VRLGSKLVLRSKTDVSLFPEDTFEREFDLVYGCVLGEFDVDGGGM
jgi:hypothetical protein